jgi:hypothetical protein
MTGARQCEFAVPGEELACLSFVAVRRTIGRPGTRTKMKLAREIFKGRSMISANAGNKITGSFAYTFLHLVSS